VKLALHGLANGQGSSRITGNGNEWNRDSPDEASWAYIAADSLLPEGRLEVSN